MMESDPQIDGGAFPHLCNHHRRATQTQNLRRRRRPEFVRGMPNPWRRHLPAIVRGYHFEVEAANLRAASYESLATPIQLACRRHVIASRSLYESPSPIGTGLSTRVRVACYPRIPFMPPWCVLIATVVRARCGTVRVAGHQCTRGVPRLCG